METSIKEKCSCGALFVVKGEEDFCEDIHQVFTSAHEPCRSIKVIQVIKPPKKEE